MREPGVVAGVEHLTRRRAILSTGEPVQDERGCSRELDVKEEDQRRVGIGVRFAGSPLNILISYFDAYGAGRARSPSRLALAARSDGAAPARPSNLRHCQVLELKR